MTAVLVAFTLLFLIFIFFFRFFFSIKNEPCAIVEGSSLINKQDILLIIAICLVYGAVAFKDAGFNYAPENDVHFSTGDSVYFSVPEDSQVASFKAFTGLNTGKYIIRAYDSGLAEYVQIGELDQEYSSLFRWNDVYLSAEDISGYHEFSITALSNLYLNEIIILDAGSNCIPVTITESDIAATALFDEQDKYADYTYLSGTYFDEIYHARTAFEHIREISPYEITHPPLGKIIISLGIRLFGMNPFGWRFSGILFGILMLIPFYVLIKKMFSSAMISCCGTLIFAFDFMHFTQTRIATIDTYAVFFIILMYLFMYLYISEDSRRYLWLGLCGLSFGFGCACKWTCIYAGCGLALIWLISFIKLVKSVSQEDKPVSTCINNILFCVCFFIIIPGTIYYLSYIPYGKASGMSGTGMLFTEEYFDIVIDNQQYMFNYHSGIVATHPYSSRWYEWLLDIFPMLYYLKYLPDGTKSVIGCFVNPLLCWSGLISVLYLILKLIFGRNNKAAFILIGFLSQLLPWVFIKRLTFEYHYFPSTVFLVLAVCFVFDNFRRCDEKGRYYIAGFTAVSLVLFAMFYPVISGKPVSPDYCKAFLEWLPKWYI